MEAQIKIYPDTPEWSNFVNDIANQFRPGELISHSFLKSAFGIVFVDIHDYSDTDDFLKEHQERQFEYMGLIDKLRNDLLTNERYYLENVKGVGYRFMPPNDQQQFAFETTIKEIKRALRFGASVMKNVRTEEMSDSNRVYGNNLVAKLGLISQIFKSQRKK